MAQSVKHQTLDFSSGHDLTIHGFELQVGLYANSVDPAWDSLSLSLTLPLFSLSLSVSLSVSLSKEINKLKKKHPDNRDF